MIPLRLPPHKQVAHMYLGTPYLQNEKLKFLIPGLIIPMVVKKLGGL